MAKAKYFNKGDVILTTPQDGFWGLAVVLSERERTPEFLPMCHIAITPLLFQREIELSELNTVDLSPLEFDWTVKSLWNKKEAPPPKMWYSNIG